METTEIVKQLETLRQDVNYLQDALGQDYSFIWSNIQVMDKNVRKLGDAVAKIQGTQRFEDVIKSAVAPTAKSTRSSKLLYVALGVGVGLTIASVNTERKKQKEVINGGAA